MASMVQRTGHGSVKAATLLLAMSALLDVTHAVQWVVGGDVQKWSFLHANSAPTFYNDWANNKTFKTGDMLLFQYDNATHSVLQVTKADFVACSLNTPHNRWGTGLDSVFISEAGTCYYVCAAPAHCAQGMKVEITATGAFVTAPPPPVVTVPSPAASNTNHVAPIVIISGVVPLVLTILHVSIAWW